MLGRKAVGKESISIPHEANRHVEPTHISLHYVFSLSLDTTREGAGEKGETHSDKCRIRSPKKQYRVSFSNDALVGEKIKEKGLQKIEGTSKETVGNCELEAAQGKHRPEA